MFGLDILNVIIGLVFIYLLLSLICATVNEILLNFFKQRAVCHKKGLKEIFCGEDGTNLLNKFYNHPLIYALYKGANSTTWWKFWEWRTNTPSYIPAKTFTIALMDLLDVNTLPQTQTLNGTVIKPDIKDALAALHKAAGNDLVKTRQNIEEWYNSVMDRVTSWYKGRSQIACCIVSLIITVVINADTIIIWQKLSNDRTLRDTVTTSAQKYIQELPKLPSGASDQTKTASSEELVTQLNKNLDKIHNNTVMLMATGLPLGWTSGELAGHLPIKAEDKVWWIKKLVGWVLTAIALTLGAPFWFKMLSEVLRLNKKPLEQKPQ